MKCEACREREAEYVLFIPYPASIDVCEKCAKEGFKIIKNPKEEKWVV